MKRPLYYLLCAIACASMVGATMPMAAIAEAIQPQATAEQQAQADATSGGTDKAEDGTNTNATTDTVEDSTATSTGASAADTENADDTAAATGTPTPSLRTQTNPAPAAISATSQTGYAHSATASQNGVTFTVSWNDAPAGTATTFHVTQTNGSSQAKARMDVPTYWDGGSQESVCDPSRPAWAGYCSLGTAGHDFTFDFTASGTYRIYFYFMDNDRYDPQNDKEIYYLRTTAEVTVNDAARPSVTQIVNNAVAQCRQETNGSEYDMALWLHDWTLDQLEYDHNLNWCSAESGLTRHQGTCESYQRIYSKLLDAAGIANGRITGNGHTWNSVKIDGKWCQMDLTWDDTSDNWYGDLDQRHLYFGLTDELMAIAHSDHTANYQKDDYAYRSTDLSNNYFVRNGKADEWAEKYADRIQQYLDAKEESFSIDADNQSFPPSISGIQNGIVAHAMNQKEWITADTKAALFAASVVATSPNGRWATSFLFKTTYLEPPARLEGEYRIALAMAPSMCVSAAASGSSLSRWGSGLSIEPDAGSGLYRIKAAALRNADGTDSQLWSLTETDGGYVVGSRSTGMVLDSRRAGTSEGNEVRLEWANGTGAQVWILLLVS
ncbi:transglutaminase domain-containing protein [Collinsella aerofaciens]|uniref:transglutaminase domain-containing protein n=1 Tax=Collinsella aerofaciens TaxID=74426 RepID=UPI00356383CF